MKKFILLTVIALTVVACGRGPKHINDVPNAQVSTLLADSEERYQRVTDPATGLSGLAEMDGSIFLPVKYTNIVACFNYDKNKDLFLVSTPEELCGVVNTSGKTVIKEEYDEIRISQETSRADSIVVFVTTKKRQRNYDYEVGPEGKKRTIRDDGYDFLHGIITPEGKELVPCEFDKVRYAGRGFFEVTTPKDKKQDVYHGLYKDGKAVVPCEYNSLHVSGSANGALACISTGKTQTWYAFDLADGGTKTKLLYDKLSIGVSDNYIIHSERNPTTRSFKAKVLNFKGDVVIYAEQYNNIKEHDGFFVCDAGAYDVLLNSGRQEIFGEKYYRLEYVNGVFIASDRNKGAKGVITKDGKWIVPCRYRKIVVEKDKILAYPGGREIKEFPLP